jgi:hypothetical protein
VENGLIHFSQYERGYIALELASSVMIHDVNDNKPILPSYDKHFQVSTLNSEAIK